MINCCNKKIASAISQKKIERERKRQWEGSDFFSPSLLTLLFLCVFSLQWHLFKSAGSSLFQYWVHINDDGCARYSTQWTIYHISICPCNEARRLNAFLWSRRNAYTNAIRYSALVWSVYLFILFLLSYTLYEYNAHNVFQLMRMRNTLMRSFRSIHQNQSNLWIQIDQPLNNMLCHTCNDVHYAHIFIYNVQKKWTILFEN